MRGSKHDTGEVLNYLLALGAATGGHWQSGHMSPIDAKAPDFETPQHADGRGNTQSRYDYPFGITVNALGLRFFDEGEAQHSYTYAKTGRTILAQPGAVAWQIYDPTGIGQHRYPHHKASFEEAADISELARKIGLAPEVLVHTIEEFNAACRDEVPFDPTRPDGKKTHGLGVPKSNWANRIETPPYRAYPVTCGITFTFGGVKVNPKAQVLNSLHEPIKGYTRPATFLGSSFTITRHSRARPATPSSADSPGSTLPQKIENARPRRTPTGLISENPARYSPCWIGTAPANSNRVAIPGEKLVIQPFTLDAFPVRSDQDAMPVALAICVFAIEFHIGLAIFGPTQNTPSRCEAVLAWS